MIFHGSTQRSLPRIQGIERLLPYRPQSQVSGVGVRSVAPLFRQLTALFIPRMAANSVWRPRR